MLQRAVRTYARRLTLRFHSGELSAAGISSRGHCQKNQVPYRSSLRYNTMVHDVKSWLQIEAFIYSRLKGREICQRALLLYNRALSYHYTPSDLLLLKLRKTE